VPINALQAVEGTPLAGQGKVDAIEFVRMVATARIVMPRSYVRLSAGRVEMSDEAQALCFLAGANSIFAGEKLLTQKNNGENRDRGLMEKLGMRFLEVVEPGHVTCAHENASCADEAAALEA
jgi:biotin synthase